jgi:DNA-directed RNA polymerase I, II, and III subunit RPABC2
MKSKDDDISSDEEIISENFNEDDLEELDLNDKINTEVSNIDVAEEDDEDTKFHTNDDIDDDDNYDENDIFTDVEPEKFINQNKRIADDERSTRPILTKYEKVRLIGTRTKQISDGSKVFVKSKNSKSAKEIAELELKYKVIPLKIKRYLNDGSFEIWSVKDLEILP